MPVYTLGRITGQNQVFQLTFDGLPLSPRNLIDYGPPRLVTMADPVMKLTRNVRVRPHSANQSSAGCGQERLSHNDAA